MPPLDNRRSKNPFAQYGFPAQLFLNLMLNGMRQPTPVQRKVLPLALEGKDVVTCYKTGSGKTLSYLLPLIAKLRSHSQIVGARALILIPTRDLAEQIAGVLKNFLRKIDLRYTLILGGHTYEGQFESLSANPDIIVATPGRLMQLLTQTDLQLSRVQLAVFDEADQLFGENKFEKEVKEILSRCPNAQRLLFSATITPDLDMFINVGLREYAYVHQEIQLPQSMKLDFFLVRPQEKPAALLLVLEKVVRGAKVVVFVSTRYHVEYLLLLLEGLYQCYGVYGKMDADQRTYALNSFREEDSAVLVVTDVAARGLDIPDLAFVLHYDYPSTHLIFVHRSGRTARAGQPGHTLTLLTHHELAHLVQLSTFVARPIGPKALNLGTLPTPLLAHYVQLLPRFQALEKAKKLADRAYEKFKQCRAQVSRKKAKNVQAGPHDFFLNEEEEDQQQFLSRLHNFVPKKSFLQLQRIALNPQNDTFLNAVERIKGAQLAKKRLIERKEKLRAKNSGKWREILEKEQIRDFQEYEAPRGKIQLVEGVEIEVTDSAKKKSLKTDFRNPSQFILAEKDPSVRTEFDELPRIKQAEIDPMLRDEAIKKNSKKRVWNKTKKTFLWQKDAEDKLSKKETGKKAYEKWKRQSKLTLPKAGENEHKETVDKAKEDWMRRRKFSHGWKEKAAEKGRGRNLKNNKTKAIEKRYKAKRISQAAKKGKIPR